MGSAFTEQLEAMVRASRSPSEPDFKLALTRLSSEIKHRLDGGSPSSLDFILESVRLLSRIRGSTHAELRMSSLFDSGVFLFTNRQDSHALECAKFLKALALQSSNRYWLRKAYILAGIAWSHVGDSGQAILEYSKGIELAREDGAPNTEATCLSNLGSTLNYAGLYREAIPCLLHAIEISQRDPSLVIYEASALCNLAQSYFHLGEHEKGLNAIHQCLKISREPIDAFTAFARVVREFTVVQLALELKRLDLARDHSKRCVHYAQISGTDRGKFSARVSVGMCEIHGGNVGKGLELLEAALADIKEPGDPEHLEALMALVRGYDQAARPEEALVQLRVVMRSLKESREKGILALLTAGGVAGNGGNLVLVPEGSDLQALNLREAQLRAVVAERELVNSRLEMLERLAVTADLREEESGAHGYRVGALSGLVAAELNWGVEARLAIDVAARLHDLGKISVPDRILLASTELRQAERHFMSTHATIGAELLSKSNIPQLRMAEEIARFHHEWWNGEGYPSKLKGKRIPIHARIVALADVFDALTHGRPFADPWPMDQAIEEIRKRRGTQFDPELTDVFLALVERLRNEHADLDEYLGRAGRNSPFLQARNKIRLMLAEERENEKKATVEGNATHH